MLVSFGSNLKSSAGAPEATILAAVEALRAKGLKFESLSPLFETPAYPPGSGPNFINAAAKVFFEGTAKELLKILQEVERDFGRDRQKRWDSRTLDLDLLAYGSSVLPSREIYMQWRDLPQDRLTEEAPGELILPHPRMQERAFVLVPLAHVDPDWRHPVLGLTVTEMRDQLPKPEIEEISQIE
ncbi:MAG: 2-amino-4-hydroxy-6-hydroxymethyldihydropteridine diphosphokinase [Pseudomonadota bacterium]